ncbi:glutamate--cysteine ligase [Adhaeribacter sp. BT258]|uniref:Glutamate--cysteine ligase n=1 Tax=Adhaeribacter terrigena TaxID=2793070 RepID=A0ABS1C0G1_9BACT|nr:glutamate-cysteine ligase family protein [Adhaeribacter terrigena]MBK0402895.1 glutamate--cysteine ligase [Adhaeribacter terrigena]
MSKPRKPLHLFEAYGVEMEYMIVKNDTLEILPITDKVIYDVAGQFDSDVELGDMAWSNELVLHVIELKTNGPAVSLEGLSGKFQVQVAHINQLLEKYNARLLGSGAHPFMDPFREMCLWPHDYNQIYEAYNKIFDCRGHGWANLQSTHLNLPFANDDEFGKLHAAIRVLLPLIPALSASSPILDNRVSGFADTRLEVYQSNQKQIPSIAGKVIPERVFSKAEYEQKIFKRIYADIAPYDEDEILRDQFLNSRGAIARFDRGAIEIRIIDIQECPQADIAVLNAVVETLKKLVAEKWTSLEEQKKWHENDLAEIFWNVVKHGQQAEIRNAGYLQLFGYDKAGSCTASELWQHLYDSVLVSTITDENTKAALTFILQNDTLSARIVKALKGNASAENIKNVYAQLTDCLKNGKQFLA